MIDGRGPKGGMPLRPAILKAVLQIAGEEGWHCLTMRKIAERIRYSPPMIYAVFDSKEAICAELVADGYQQLYRHMSAAAAGISDPVRRLWALLGAFRLFAWENQATYEAMFGLTSLVKPGETVRRGEYAGACLGLLGDTLLQGKVTCPLPPIQAARAVIAAAHGVIAMHFAGLVATQSEAAAMYDAVLQGLLSGWGL
jgi:AcrR family transcriptional regulator